MDKKSIEKYLIVGLGNPGEEYEKTRHNFGFDVLDCFLSERNESGDIDFPIEFHEEPKFKSLFCMINFGDKKVFLAKPQTYMNLSGKAVRKIKDYYKINLKNILIVHDDIDIELGKMKISEDSRSAGHRGVESIINELGTKKFSRLRLGIKNEELFSKTKMSTEKFVLEKFTKDEENKYIKTRENAAEAIGCFIRLGIEETKKQA